MKEGAFMNNKDDQATKWIACSFDYDKGRWLIEGTIEPQKNLPSLMDELTSLYPNIYEYGIWLVNKKLIINRAYAPSNEVYPVANLFRSETLIKSPSDISEGMIFVSKKTNLEHRVLAVREGFVMTKKLNDVPVVHHWETLINNFELNGNS